MYQQYYNTIYSESTSTGVDDAWYDDEKFYAETLVEQFTKQDWETLSQKLEKFNESTTIKVAESLDDTYRLESIEILLKILDINNNTSVLNETATALYDLYKENLTMTKISLTIEQEKFNNLEKKQNKSYILSKYLPFILKQLIIKEETKT